MLFLNKLLKYLTVRYQNLTFGMLTRPHRRSARDHPSHYFKYLQTTIEQSRKPPKPARLPGRSTPSLTELQITTLNVPISRLANRLTVPPSMRRSEQSQHVQFTHVLPQPINIQKETHKIPEQVVQTKEPTVMLT